MPTILLPTAYLPPVSWMAAAVQSEKINIECRETYPKQTFRNRCRIATSSGILNLTVPVIKANGNHTITADIRIDNSGNWQLLHWRSILTAYNKSPYFLYYRDEIEPVFAKKHELLIHLNTELLNVLLKCLTINTLEYSFTFDFEANPSVPDLRNQFSPKTKHQPGTESAFQRYIQVFEEKHGFLPDLSIVDLLFNIGPDALSYLAEINPAAYL